MSIVKVDQEKCIGCGACVAIDPENFDFNDEGISTVINEIATDAAKDAEEACPVLAIDIIEESEKQENKKQDKNEKHESDDECECKHECDCEDCEDECCCEDCDCEDCECEHNDKEEEKEDE